MSTISKPRVPEGLRDMMKDLTREILKEKPIDIYDFAENYFQSRLPEKENYAVTNFEGGSGKYDFSYIQNPQRYQIPVAFVYSIIPEGLTNLIKDLIKAVLREQPQNLCDFAVEYFRHIKTATTTESQTLTKEINYSAYENYFINKERFLFTPYVKCTCGRTLGEVYTNSYQLENLNSIHQIHSNESTLQSKHLVSDDTNNNNNSNNAKKFSENDSDYSEKYINSIYIIQRYFRRYLKRKNATTKLNKLPHNTPSIEHDEKCVEPVETYDTPTHAMPLVPQLQLNQNETENNSEDVSYTSASTAQLSATESGREISELSTSDSILTKTIIEGVEMENDEKNMTNDLKQFDNGHANDETITKGNKDVDNLKKEIHIKDHEDGETRNNESQIIENIGKEIQSQEEEKEKLINNKDSKTDEIETTNINETNKKCSSKTDLEDKKHVIPFNIEENCKSVETIANDQQQQVTIPDSRNLKETSDIQIISDKSDKDVADHVLNAFNKAIHKESGVNLETASENVHQVEVLVHEPLEPDDKKLKDDEGITNYENEADSLEKTMITDNATINIISKDEQNQIQDKQLDTIIENTESTNKISQSDMDPKDISTNELQKQLVQGANKSEIDTDDGKKGLEIDDKNELKPALTKQHDATTKSETDTYKGIQEDSQNQSHDEVDNNILQGKISRNEINHKDTSNNELTKQLNEMEDKSEKDTDKVNNEVPKTQLAQKVKVDEKNHKIKIDSTIIKQLDNVTNKSEIVTDKVNQESLKIQIDPNDIKESQLKTDSQKYKGTIDEIKLEKPETELSESKKNGEGINLLAKTASDPTNKITDSNLTEESKNLVQNLNSSDLKLNKEPKLANDEKIDQLENESLNAAKTTDLNIETDNLIQEADLNKNINRSEEANNHDLTDDGNLKEKFNTDTNTDQQIVKESEKTQHQVIDSDKVDKNVIGDTTKTSSNLSKSSTENLLENEVVSKSEKKSDEVNQTPIQQETEENLNKISEEQNKFDLNSTNESNVPRLETEKQDTNLDKSYIDELEETTNQTEKLLETNEDFKLLKETTDQSNVINDDKSNDDKININNEETAQVELNSTENLKSNNELDKKTVETTTNEDENNKQKIFKIKSQDTIDKNIDSSVKIKESQNNDENEAAVEKTEQNNSSIDQNINISENDDQSQPINKTEALQNDNLKNISEGSNVEVKKDNAEESSEKDLKKATKKEDKPENHVEPKNEIEVLENVQSIKHYSDLKTEYITKEPNATEQIENNNQKSEFSNEETNNSIKSLASDLENELFSKNQHDEIVLHPTKTDEVEVLENVESNKNHTDLQTDNISEQLHVDSKQTQDNENKSEATSEDISKKDKSEAVAEPLSENKIVFENIESSKKTSDLKTENISEESHLESKQIQDYENKVEEITGDIIKTEQLESVVEPINKNEIDTHQKEVAQIENVDSNKSESDVKSNNMAVEPHIANQDNESKTGETFGDISKNKQSEAVVELINKKEINEKEVQVIENVKSNESKNDLKTENISQESHVESKQTEDNENKAEGTSNEISKSEQSEAVLEPINKIKIDTHQEEAAPLEVLDEPGNISKDSLINKKGIEKQNVESNKSENDLKSENISEEPRDESKKTHDNEYKAEGTSDTISKNEQSEADQIENADSIKNKGDLTTEPYDESKQTQDNENNADVTSKEAVLEPINIIKNDTHQEEAAPLEVLDESENISKESLINKKGIEKQNIECNKSDNDLKTENISEEPHDESKQTQDTENNADVTSKEISKNEHSEAAQKENVEYKNSENDPKTKNVSGESKQNQESENKAEGISKDEKSEAVIEPLNKNDIDSDQKEAAQIEVLENYDSNKNINDLKTKNISEESHDESKQTQDNEDTTKRTSEDISKSEQSEAVVEPLNKNEIDSDQKEAAKVEVLENDEPNKSKIDLKTENIFKESNDEFKQTQDNEINTEGTSKDEKSDAVVKHINTNETDTHEKDAAQKEVLENVESIKNYKDPENKFESEKTQDNENKNIEDNKNISDLKTENIPKESHTKSGQIEDNKSKTQFSNETSNEETNEPNDVTEPINENEIDIYQKESDQTEATESTESNTNYSHHKTENKLEELQVESVQDNEIKTEGSSEDLSKEKIETVTEPINKNEIDNNQKNTNQTMVLENVESNKNHIDAQTENISLGLHAETVGSQDDENKIEKTSKEINEKEQSEPVVESINQNEKKDTNQIEVLENVPSIKNLSDLNTENMLEGQHADYEKTEGTSEDLQNKKIFEKEHSENFSEPILKHDIDNTQTNSDQFENIESIKTHSDLKTENTLESESADFRQNKGNENNTEFPEESCAEIVNKETNIDIKTHVIELQNEQIGQTSNSQVKSSAIDDIVNESTATKEEDLNLTKTLLRPELITNSGNNLEIPTEKESKILQTDSNENNDDADVSGGKDEVIQELNNNKDVDQRSELSKESSSNEKREHKEDSLNVSQKIEKSQTKSDNTNQEECKDDKDKDSVHINKQIVSLQKQTSEMSETGEKNDEVINQSTEKEKDDMVITDNFNDKKSNESTDMEQDNKNLKQSNLDKSENNVDTGDSISKGFNNSNNDANDRIPKQEENDIEEVITKSYLKETQTEGHKIVSNTNSNVDIVHIEGGESIETVEKTKAEDNQKTLNDIEVNSLLTDSKKQDTKKSIKRQYNISEESNKSEEDSDELSHLEYKNRLKRNIELQRTQSSEHDTNKIEINSLSQAEISKNKLEDEKQNKIYVDDNKDNDKIYDEQIDNQEEINKKSSENQLKISQDEKFSNDIDVQYNILNKSQIENQIDKNDNVKQDHYDFVSPNTVDTKEQQSSDFDTNSSTKEENENMSISKIDIEPKSDEINSKNIVLGNNLNDVVKPNSEDSNEVTISESEQELHTGEVQLKNNEIQEKLLDKDLKDTDIKTVAIESHSDLKEEPNLNTSQTEDTIERINSPVQKSKDGSSKAANQSQNINKPLKIEADKILNKDGSLKVLEGSENLQTLKQEKLEDDSNKTLAADTAPKEKEQVEKYQNDNEIDKLKNNLLEVNSTNEDNTQVSSSTNMNEDKNKNLKELTDDFKSEKDESKHSDSDKFTVSQKTEIAETTLDSKNSEIGIHDSESNIAKSDNKDDNIKNVEISSENLDFANKLNAKDSKHIPRIGSFNDNETNLNDSKIATNVLATTSDEKDNPRDSQMETLQLSSSYDDKIKSKDDKDDKNVKTENIILSSEIKYPDSKSDTTNQFHSDDIDNTNKIENTNEHITKPTDNSTDEIQKQLNSEKINAANPTLYKNEGDGSDILMKEGNINKGIDLKSNIENSKNTKDIDNDSNNKKISEESFHDLSEKQTNLGADDRNLSTNKPEYMDISNKSYPELSPEKGKVLNTSMDEISKDNILKESHLDKVKKEQSDANEINRSKEPEENVSENNPPKDDKNNLVKDRSTETNESNVKATMVSDANQVSFSENIGQSATTETKGDNNNINDQVYFDDFLDDKHNSEYTRETPTKSSTSLPTKGGIYEFANEVQEQNEQLVRSAQAPSPPNYDPFYEDEKETAAIKIQNAYRKHMQKHVIKYDEDISKSKKAHRSIEKTIDENDKLGKSDRSDDTASQQNIQNNDSLILHDKLNKTEGNELENQTDIEKNTFDKKTNEIDQKLIKESDSLSDQNQALERSDGSEDTANQQNNTQSNELENQPNIKNMDKETNEMVKKLIKECENTPIQQNIENDESLSLHNDPNKTQYNELENEKDIGKETNAIKESVNSDTLLNQNESKSKELILNINDNNQALETSVDSEGSENRQNKTQVNELENQTKIEKTILNKENKDIDKQVIKESEGTQIQQNTEHDESLPLHDDPIKTQFNELENEKDIEKETNEIKESANSDILLNQKESKSKEAILNVNDNNQALEATGDFKDSKNPQNNTQGNKLENQPSVEKTLWNKETNEMDKKIIIDSDNLPTKNESKLNEIILNKMDNNKTFEKNGGSEHTPNQEHIENNEHLFNKTQSNELENQTYMLDKEKNKIDKKLFKDSDNLSDQNELKSTEVEFLNQGLERSHGSEDIANQQNYTQCNELENQIDIKKETNEIEESVNSDTLLNQNESMSKELILNVNDNNQVLETSGDSEGFENQQDNTQGNELKNQTKVEKTILNKEIKDIDKNSIKETDNLATQNESKEIILNIKDNNKTIEKSGGSDDTASKENIEKLLLHDESNELENQTNIKKPDKETNGMVAEIISGSKGTAIQQNIENDKNLVLHKEIDNNILENQANIENNILEKETNEIDKRSVKESVNSDILSNENVSKSKEFISKEFISSFKDINQTVETSRDSENITSQVNNTQYNELENQGNFEKTILNNETNQIDKNLIKDVKNSENLSNQNESNTKEFILNVTKSFLLEEQRNSRFSTDDNSITKHTHYHMNESKQTIPTEDLKVIKLQKGLSSNIISNKKDNISSNDTDSQSKININSKSENQVPAEIETKDNCTENEENCKEGQKNKIEKENIIVKNKDTKKSLSVEKESKLPKRNTIECNNDASDYEKEILKSNHNYKTENEITSNEDHNNEDNTKESAIKNDKSINNFNFEPTAPAEEDIQSLVSLQNIQTKLDQAARKIQNAFRKFIKRKSNLDEKTESSKSNWFVGDEPIVANDSLTKTKSEISFEETEAYVELTTNPSQYLVDSSSNLETIDANNISRTPTAPVSNRSRNSVDLAEDHSTIMSKDTVSAIGAAANGNVKPENIKPKANDLNKNNSSDDKLASYSNLINNFINSERHYSEAVNYYNPSAKNSFNETKFLTPDFQQISKILSDSIDVQKGQSDTQIPYERLEEPCIKKTISRSRLTDESIEVDRKFANTDTSSSSSSSSDIDDTEDSLSTKTIKLHKPDMAITKMQQRRDSTTKVANIEKPKDYNFDEPLVGPMDNLDTDEEGIVVNKLQREETRESSAQSDIDVIIGGGANSDKDDNFNFLDSIDIDETFPPKGSLKRVHTIAGDGDAKSLLKNVTIDESIKYIEPPDYELNSGSLCLDDDTAENIRRKMMAYSLSEADSDCFDKNANNADMSNTEAKTKKYDDFNISTALVENGGSSTETESTIVSAVTKIQAGARGYLTRKRLGKTSVTSDGKSMTHDEINKASFGNAAISESLEHLVQEAAAKRIQRVYRQHYRQKLTEAKRKDGENISPEFAISTENTLAQKRSIMLQRGDALRNNSTPDEGNSSSNGSGSDNSKLNAKVNEKDKCKTLSTSDKSNNVEKQTLKSCDDDKNSSNASEAAKTAATIRAKKIEENKMRWLAMRQNSMPVQIDSEVLRVIPKYMRKKIKSAEGEKKKYRRRLPMD